MITQGNIYISSAREGENNENEMEIVYFSGRKEKMLTFIICVFVSEYYVR